MTERLTAERQLTRILELLPRAARADAAPLADLATALGLDEREVLKDLTEVWTRSFYHPSTTADSIQIYIEDDQVSVWTTGEFQRPVRLSPRESIALGLGLRVLIASREESHDPKLEDLATYLEERLLDGATKQDVEYFDVEPHALVTGGVHETLTEAARACRRCRIEYVKSGADTPTSREVDPYVMLASNGRWYIVAHCHVNSAVRVFRMDRIIAATTLDSHFQLPIDFDPMQYVTDGRVYRAEEFEEVGVRYSPRIARWIVEQGPVEELEDGSVVVRYSVADRDWLVRHVLEHGAEAEVLYPLEVRDAVVMAVEKVLGTH